MDSHGVALILVKDTANTLRGYCPVSDGILKICLQAKKLVDRCLQAWSVLYVARRHRHNPRSLWENRDGKSKRKSG